MKLLVVIPALNEEQSIQSTIERCLAARELIVSGSSVDDVEITVVSDGSTDRTVERAMAYEEWIRVIVFPENRGYGAAIMEAWSQSDADLLSFLDADGTCDPSFFVEMCCKLLSEQVDIVLGCRLNSKSEMPALRRLGNFLFARLLTALSNKAVQDTASGMRVVRRSVLRNLYPLPTGLQFTPAMSARAMLSDKISIVEIDMPYAEREGRSKLSVLRDGVRFLAVILSTAFLYRPAKLLNAAAGAVVLAGGLLMVKPVLLYCQTRTVAEWMIYRFLVSGLTAQVGVLLWGAGAIASRTVVIAIRDDVGTEASPRSGPFRNGAVWFVITALIVVGVTLVWPSVLDLWTTGHTQQHWSRFVLAVSSFDIGATLLVFWIISMFLESLGGRAKYLASHPIAGGEPLRMSTRAAGVDDGNVTP